jgi:small subunit ribosomal protein S16
LVTIRLARTGRKKYSTYRIVAAESSRPTTGKFIAVLGHYNPHSKNLVLKKDQIEKYLQVGAQPSNSVIKLLTQESVKLPAWVRLHTKHRAAKSEPQQASVETPAKPAADEAAKAETPAVAVAAAEASEKTESKAPAATDPDNDHTDTAASEAEQADAATKADDVAAEVALHAAQDADQP